MISRLPAAKLPAGIALLQSVAVLCSGALHGTQQISESMITYGAVTGQTQGWTYPDRSQPCV